MKYIVGEKGKGGDSGRVAKEDPNTLRSASTARVVDLISEGEIGGLVDGLKSIYFDDTPLENADGTFNFYGVVVETREGSPTQSFIPGFPAVEAETSVDAEVLNGLPVTRAIIDSDTDAVRVKVRVPQLTAQDTSTGDLHATAVQISIDVQANGGGFVEVLTDSIAGKSTAPYEREYIVDLPAGGAPWNVRVNRLTADSVVQATQNKTFWSSYTEIIYAKLMYADSAVVGITIDAEQFGTSIPKRSYDIYGVILRVPSNYDPVTRVYTGIWDGTFKLAWSDNPAWVFYDLLTNDRYGLGGVVNVAQVDKWGLYDIAQYCDEMVDDGFGGVEPRFTFNAVLNTRREAYAVLNNLASSFRGMVYWGAGVVVATQDSPVDAVKLVTPANVINGEFQYSGKSLKDRHTAALVTWSDPADSGRPAIEVVEDAEGITQLGWRTVDLVAYGCASRGQARRVGKAILDTEKYEPEIVSYQCSFDHADLRPGSIIKISDPSIAGDRFGGRVLSATTSAVTLDNVPGLSQAASNYTLSVVLPDGSIESLPVLSVVGSVVSVTGLFTAAPQSYAIWMLSSSNVLPRQFRVSLVAETGDGVYKITATEHDPNKYGRIEQDLPFDGQSFSQLPSGVITAPQSTSLSEYLYIDGTVVKGALTLAAEMPGDPRVTLIEFQLKGPNDPDYQPIVTPTSSPSIDVLDIRPGAYQARARTIDALGLPSSWVESIVFQAVGKTAAPSAPSNFTAAIRPDTGLVLTIDPIADVDRDEYSFYIGDTFAEAVRLVRAKSNEFVWKTALAGTHTFWVVAHDTTGNDSSPVSVSITVNLPAQPVITSRFDDRSAVFDWDEVASDFKIAAYSISYGGSVVAEVTATTFSQIVNWVGSRSFTVVAVDIAGNTSAGAVVEVNPSAPGKPTLSNQVIDNNVLLKYSSLAGALPIDHYRLLKGADFATAVDFANKAGSSTFTALFESVKGTYTYWMVAVDSAGNESVEENTSAFVNQPPDYILYARYSEFDTAWTGTKTNALVTGSGTLLVPVIVGESYEDHFTTRGWTTPQNQVDAGFEHFIQPSATSAVYEKIIDYGSVIDQSLVTVSPTYNLIDGSVTTTLTLSYSTDGITYTAAAAGVEQIFASNFQYIKIHLDIAATGGDDLLEIRDIETRLDKKLINDAGTAACLSTDASGTSVSFTQTFIDVQSITLTPQGTTPVTAVYDFVDVPNPTTFSVYLFDDNGNRVSGDCGWSVKGY